MKTKSIYIVVMLFVLLTNNTFAQVSLYSFNSSIASYTNMVSPVVLATGPIDNNVYRGVSIGFNFYYNGNVYNTVNIHANGYLSFGNGTASNTPTIISSGANANLVSLFNNDLIGALNGQLANTLVGTAPNRVFVVEWKNFKRIGVNPLDTLTGQIKLYESNNIIELHYSKVTRGNGTFVNTNSTLQVGLKGSGADYNARNAINNTTNWQNSLSSLLSTDAMVFSDTVSVPTNLLYTYTPNVISPAAAINLIFTSITPNSMVLNFVDNATTENNFIILRSTDNINFFPYASVVSTTTSTTGNSYTYTANGLVNGTTYYWQVQSTANTPGIALSGSQSTLAGSICGTYTIGVAGTYTTITAAVNALKNNGLSCSVILELLPTYTLSVEPALPIVFSFMGNDASKTLTLRPSIGVSALVLNATTSIFDINGMQHLIIDGRPGGLGTNKELTIENSSTTLNTIRIINNVDNIALKHLIIKGSNATVSSGVIVMGNSSLINNNITIDSCILTNSNTNPANLIYSNNNANTDAQTKNVVIINNEFSNWFSATSATSAISGVAGSSNWTIDNNHFYQTSTRTYTNTSIHYAIFINTAFSGIHVLNNKIGGSTINNGGLPYNMQGSVGTRFVAININSTISNFSLPNNNTVFGNSIKNITLFSTSTASSSPGVFSAIYTFGGANFSIGNNLNANTIGSQTINGSIEINNGDGAFSFGIVAASTGTNIIASNLIAGINIFGVNTMSSANFTGIVANQGNANINNNIIGGSLINSISNSTSASSVANGSLVGISASGSINSGVGLITNNIISNITNNYESATSTTSITRGISVLGGIYEVLNNQVSTLKSALPQSGLANFSSIHGIYYGVTLSSNNHKIIGNTINDLTITTNNANALSAAGIMYINPTLGSGAGIIANNKIYAIGAPDNTNNTTEIKGIQVIAGDNKVYNNFISLGKSITNTDITSPNLFKGISKVSNTNTLVAHNTVLINGSGVLPTTNSTIAYITELAPILGQVDSVFNNIFVNTRVNASGAIKHYAIYLVDSFGYKASNNAYYTPDTIFAFSNATSVNYNTLTAWQMANASDANSVIFNPTFISNTDLHINNVSATPLESAARISYINLDLDSNNRPGPMSSINGGGTLPDIGADEFDGFVDNDIEFTTIQNLLTPKCTGSIIPIVAIIKNININTINLAITPLTVEVFASYNAGVPISIGVAILNSGLLFKDSSVSISLNPAYTLLTGNYVFTGLASIANDFNLANNNILNNLLVNTLPLTPVITASALAVCAPDIIILKSSSSTGNTWSNGATIDSVIVILTDTFTLTVTDSNTCTSLPSAIVTATINTLPIITATPSLSTLLVAANTTFSNPISLSGGVSYAVTVIPSSNVSSSTTNGIYTGSSITDTIGNNGTLGSGETIAYTVVGTDANGCLDTVNFIVTIDILVDLSNIAIDKTINIAPNPASNLFIVSSKDNFTLRMVDRSGKEIYSNKEYINTAKIDVSNFSNGMYVLYITTQKETTIRNITIQRE